MPGPGTAPQVRTRVDSGHEDFSADHGREPGDVRPILSIRSVDLFLLRVHRVDRIQSDRVPHEDFEIL
jgi:hypothetical protein